VERAQLVTSDGHRLDADLELATGPARGAVAVCHPHPHYGGDRFNPVVDAVFRALPPAGFHALRFDFRAEHGGGVAERLDVVAALDLLAQRVPDVALHLVGYSFGAVVALSTADPRVRSVVAVAPPLPAMAAAIEAPRVPALVLAPAHDQFCAPGVAAPIVSAWPDAELAEVEMADHFLAGRTGAVADAVVAWLSARRPG
jgi:alpha/beta superfamily hydrolase